MVNEAQRQLNLDIVDRARRAQLAVNDILAKAQRPKDIQLIGIGGLYAAGKDEVADHLVTRYGYEKTWMSYPLHKWLEEQNPWFRLDKPIYAMEGWVYEPGEFHTYNEIVHQVGYVGAKEQEEVRRALQKIGTNCGRRMIDWDVWVDAMKRQLTEWIEQGKTKLIVTGIRYPNELEAITSLGGETLWVERPEARARHEQRLKEDSERVTQGLEPLMHDSEVSLDSTDYAWIIDNDQDLDELKRRAEEWHVMRYGS